MDRALSAIKFRVRVRDSALLDVLIITAFSTAFMLLIAAKGVPALRHDWTWPYTAAQVRASLVTSWGGWNPVGLGSPEAYPNNYLIALVISGLSMVLGSSSAFAIFILFLGAAIALSARALAADASPQYATPAIAVALFNPWVYNKAVAGHILMLLAYAGTMWLIAELSLPAHRNKTVSICLALAMTLAQTQFFVIAMMLVAFRSAEKEPRRAALFGLVLFAPALVGIWSNLSYLHSILYTLAWQQIQSVPPSKAPLLLGYFSRYAESGGSWFVAGMSFMAGTAVFGAWQMLAEPGRRRTAVILCAIALTACITAFGSTGPFGHVYSAAVVHLRITALFRELYDLLGYLAIAYVVFVAFAARQSKWGRAAAIVGATFLVVAWITKPPSTFVVSRSVIPSVVISAPPNTRFALLPSVQPMSFANVGAGVDPDAYSLPGNVQPLNTYEWDEPSSFALQGFAKGVLSSAALSDLSVSEVISRPWLRAREDAVPVPRAVLANPYSGRYTQRLKAAPELAIQEIPAVALVTGDLGANAIFSGDVPNAPWARALWGKPLAFSVLVAQNRYVDPSAGWVDARLLFVRYPRAVQYLGGEGTTSKQAFLTLPNAAAVLAFGTLRSSDGTIITRSAHGYEWTPLHRTAGLRVRCDGYCIVVGTADRVPLASAAPAHADSEAVPFHNVLPALSVAKVASHARSLLRYNVTYNGSWLAIADRHILNHVRIDHIINGWLLPAADHPEEVVIVNAVGIIQVFLQGVATVMVLVLLATLVLRSVKERLA